MGSTLTGSAHFHDPEGWGRIIAPAAGEKAKGRAFIREDLAGLAMIPVMEAKDQKRRAFLMRSAWSGMSREKMPRKW